MKHKIQVLQFCSICTTAFFLLLASTSPVFADYTQSQIQELVGRARKSRDYMTAKDAEEFRNAAERMYDQGNAQEAREVLSLVCRTKYVNCGVLCDLADYSLDQMGDSDPFHPAEKYLDRAIKLDPKCSRAWTILADTSFKRGDVSKALIYSDRSITASRPKPPYKLAYMVRAAILAQLQRYDEALKCTIDAERQAGYRAELWRIKGSILENLKRYGDAAASYRKAVSMTDQNRDWMTFQIVRCLEKQNLNKEAMVELSRLIRANPGDAEAFRARSSIRVKLNDLTGAITDLSKALDLEPTTKSYHERAKLYESTGRKDLAKKDEQAAAKLTASPY